MLELEKSINLVRLAHRTNRNVQFKGYSFTFELMNGYVGLMWLTRFIECAEARITGKHTHTNIIIIISVYIESIISLLNNTCKSCASFDTNILFNAVRIFDNRNRYLCHVRHDEEHAARNGSTYHFMCECLPKCANVRPYRCRHAGQVYSNHSPLWSSSNIWRIWFTVYVTFSKIRRCVLCT